jgi:adenine phosphoribosyltransferase
VADASTELDLSKYIRDIPDFPKPGIIYKDITPLLADAEALRQAVDRLTEPFMGQGVELVVAAEARGFLFGPAVAYHLGAGFAPVRKPGKLPYDTHSIEYELEYGMDTLQIHTDGIRKEGKILLVDDVLATGGTMAATSQLVRQAGGDVVGYGFIIELGFLKGREKLNHQTPVVSLLSY